MPSIFTSICILLFSGILIQCNGIRWLGLYRFNRPNKAMVDGFTNTECRLAKSYGVRRQQMKFCRDDKKAFAMHSVVKASQVVAYYCPHMFQDRRWNCTNVRSMPSITPDLKKNTREQAVVHAFSSAAIVYEIARGCSMSRITHCYCGLDTPGTEPKENFRWGGCSDNLETGEVYAREFLGYRHAGGKRSRKRRQQLSGRSSSKSQTKKRRRKRSISRLIRSHNYKVGIEIMKSNRKLVCRCNGVSGSCTTKICFTRLERIDNMKVKSVLRQQYLKAKYVSLGQGGRKLVSKSFENGAATSKPVEPLDLVFNEHSPDYCEPDSRVGSAGTRGRLCRLNVGKHIPDHCHNMCCGRGYTVENSTRVVDCHCRVTTKFLVLCKNCTQNVTKYFCQ